MAEAAKKIRNMEKVKKLDPLKETLKKVKKQFSGWCSTCSKEAPILPIAQIEKKKEKRITIKSAKAKARKAQQEAAALIREVFGLDPEDVKSVTMGSSGQDLEFSARAREVWPFHAVEITAKLNASVWAKFAQAQKHAEKQLSGKIPGNGRPIFIFKKNGTPLFAMVQFEDLLKVLSESQWRSGGNS